MSIEFPPLPVMILAAFLSFGLVAGTLGIVQFSKFPSYKYIVCSALGFYTFFLMGIYFCATLPQISRII